MWLLSIKTKFVFIFNLYLNGYDMDNNAKFPLLFPIGQIQLLHLNMYLESTKAF